MLELIQNEFRNGNFDESKRLCLTTPNYLQNEDILNLLGLIEIQNNNQMEAIKYFKLTLKINSINPKTLNNIGHLLLLRKKYNSSIIFLKKAIKADKKFFPAYLNLSIVYKNINKNQDGIKNIKNYLSIEKNNFEAYANLGKLYFDIKNYSESLKYYNIALKLNDKNALIYYNLGLLFDRQNKFKKSILYYKKSINLNSNFYDAHFNLSVLYLKIGKCKDGINLYDTRFYKNQNRNKNILEKKFLNLTVSSIDKKNKLYVLSEQGYGDIFQFSRLILFLKNKQYNTYFVVNDELFEFYLDQPLFSNLIKKSDFLKSNPKNVISIPLMSIPNIFKLHKDDYNYNQYIFAKKEKVEQWSKLINKNFFNVGIAWQAGNSLDNYERSIPIKYFKKLKKLKKLKLISLHPKNLLEDYDSHKDLYNDIVFFDEMDKKYKFVDSAAIISNLDLVISVDTSLAHLSASMNKETWIMLSYYHDWRWGLKNTNTHWYKSVKLFRSNKKNDWKKIFEKIMKIIPNK